MRKKIKEELSNKVINEWNKSKRSKEDLMRYNKNMGKIRAGINPFEKDENENK